MSISYIPEKAKIRLWGQAAGRCEYDGCNEPLWLDTLTKAEFNTAYIAHIIADRPDGPRGDPELSELLKDKISNLMLLCDVHHRLIDKEDIDGHPIERLQRMKLSHENRVELVGSLAADKQSHVLLYGANIGQQSSPVSFQKAAAAMLPERYPAESRPIALGVKNSSVIDRDQAFWAAEGRHLWVMFTRHVEPRFADGSIQHLSVFAAAPQPLLMLLGALLSDIPVADIYQLHREPATWRWLPHSDDSPFQIEEPSRIEGPPALILSLSATIDSERITAVLENPTIWRVTIPCPNNDFLKSREQAQEFRKAMRILLDRIKSYHGTDSSIHVFPAMPVSLAVELGRVLMPKADLPLHIYDENRACGGFTYALTIQGGTLAGEPNTGLHSLTIGMTGQSRLQ